jgi:hypothetical protein
MCKTREIRLTNVPESVYLTLLEYKAKQEQRLKRVCTFTDALMLMSLEAKAFTNLEKDFPSGYSVDVWQQIENKIKKMETVLKETK